MKKTETICPRTEARRSVSWDGGITSGGNHRVHRGITWSLAHRTPPFGGADWKPRETNLFFISNIQRSKIMFSQRLY